MFTEICMLQNLCMSGNFMKTFLWKTSRQAHFLLYKVLNFLHDWLRRLLHQLQESLDSLNNCLFLNNCSDKLSDSWDFWYLLDLQLQCNLPSSQDEWVGQSINYFCSQYGVFAFEEGNVQMKVVWVSGQIYILL